MKRNSLLQKLTQLSYDAVLFLDQSGRILDCNDVCLNLFGDTHKNELTGKLIFDFVSEDDREVTAGFYKKALDLHSEFKLAVYFIPIKGKEFPGIFAAHSIDPKTGIVVALIHDLRMKRDLEAFAIERAEQLSMLSTINDELRNAGSVDEMNKRICCKLFELSGASEAWFLSTPDEHHFQLTSAHQYPYSTTRVFERKALDVSNLLFESSETNYIFEDRKVIDLPVFYSSQRIKAQYIVSSSFQNGKCYAIGLNFSRINAKNRMAREFLRTISTQVFSAYDRLESTERLIDNESKYRNLTENIEGIMAVIDSKGIIRYISPSISAYSYQPEEVTGKRATLFFAGEDLVVFRRAFREVLSSENEIRTIPQIKYRLRDGTFSYGHIFLKNLIQNKGIGGIAAYIKDISERVAYEDKLRLSEEKFRNIFNSSSDAIYITDLKGNFIEVNEVALERTGFSKEELLNLNLKKLLYGLPEKKVDEYLNRLLNEGKVVTEDVYLNRFGQEIFFEATGRVIDYQGIKALLHRSIDVSSRKKFERQILEAITSTQEKEKSRFARELHDGIGPYLSAIKLFLKTLSVEKDDDERMKISHKAIQSIDEVIRNLKDISNNLSPRILNHFGVVTALKSFIQRVSKDGLSIHLNSNMESLRMDGNMEISVFRMITELINNSLKYSEAQEIKIAIMKSENKLMVQYIDNGKGFDYEKVISEAKGSGLYNILNRVNLMHGKSEFKTWPGKGVNFRAIFDIV